MNGFRWLAVAAALVLSPVGDIHAAATSAPPAEYRPTQIVPKADASLVASHGMPLRIALPEVTAAETRRLQQKNAAATAKPRAKGNALAIGFAREVPQGARIVVLASLDWQEVGDGARVARVEVHSPGAAALRLGLGMSQADPDIEVRFAGAGDGAKVHGPYAANTIGEAASRFGRFVTPVLEGSTAIIELHAAPGAVTQDASLLLASVSHIVVSPSSLSSLSAKDARDIGSSGSCNLDLACVQPSSALQQASNSVAKLVFDSREGFTALCSGTLINDTTTSFTPYLFTAAHCIEGAFEASTIDAFWFFKAQSCGSRATPAFVQQGGGAMLLARSEDWDWALLRLQRMPPSGAYYSAWRAEPVPQLAVGTGLHHPQGDLLKFSQGSTPGYQVFEDGSSFITMQWSQGTTEVGSSGSALFTFLAGGGYYEVRGGLFGGDASCGNRLGSDYFSRMDNMLPLVRQYLTPDQPVTGSQTVVLEFYNAALNHYFITADANEINLLDTGVLRGWERTGERFLANSAPSPGTNPVCRFYLKPEVGDSHFYSADPAECARVGQQFGQSWVFESPSVFWIALPNAATSACPAGTRPLWRFFNRITTNHRYTGEVKFRDDMRKNSAWIAEGYGPDAVIMCSPATN